MLFRLCLSFSQLLDSRWTNLAILHGFCGIISFRLASALIPALQSHPPASFMLAPSSRSFVPVTLPSRCMARDLSPFFVSGSLYHQSKQTNIRTASSRAPSSSSAAPRRAQRKIAASAPSKSSVDSSSLQLLIDSFLRHRENACDHLARALSLDFHGDTFLHVYLMALTMNGLIIPTVSEVQTARSLVLTFLQRNQDHPAALRMCLEFMLQFGTEPSRAAGPLGVRMGPSSASASGPADTTDMQVDDSDDSCVPQDPFIGLPSPPIVWNSSFLSTHVLKQVALALLHVDPSSTLSLRTLISLFLHGLSIFPLSSVNCG